MTTTILVPLDGSATAEQAIPYANRVAQALSANLLLLQAATPHVFTGTELVVEHPTAIADAGVYLDQLALLLRTWDLTVETSVAHSQDAATAIVDEVRAKDVDYVIMTTHGRSAPGRWLYGSVADEVLRRAPVPVMLVPPESAAVWPETRPPRILVPLDGSPLSESVLPTVSTLGAEMNACLILMRALEWPPIVAASDIDTELYPPLAEQLDEIDRYLATSAQRVSGAVPAVRTCVKLGRPGLAITDAAQEEQADLIAMATHGRSGLIRMLLGSVATSTLRHARVPVLFVHPDRS
jgi:nucleotide-binding universal stress UspA family protein